MLFLLAFTSADIIFHTFLELHWILSVKRFSSQFFFFNRFTQIFVILPPVWLSNLGCDLPIDNIVQLGLADTKIGSQNAVKKVLELMEKWKHPNFRGKFCFFQKSVGNMMHHFFTTSETINRSKFIHDKKYIYYQI